MLLNVSICVLIIVGLLWQYFINEKKLKHRNRGIVIKLMDSILVIFGSVIASLMIYTIVVLIALQIYPTTKNIVETSITANIHDQERYEMKKVYERSFNLDWQRYWLDNKYYHVNKEDIEVEYIDRD